MYYKILLASAISSLVLVLSSIVFSSNENICPFDDGVDYSKISDSSFYLIQYPLIEKCSDLELKAYKFSEKFEKILAQGKEDKRNFLIQGLKSIANKKQGDNNYMINMIAKQIEDNGYLINKLGMCDTGSLLVSDLMGIKYIFGKNKSTGCDLIITYGYLGEYYENKCSFTMSQMGIWQKAITKQYLANKGSRILDMTEYQKIDGLENIICTIQNENELAKKNRQPQTNI